MYLKQFSNKSKTFLLSQTLRLFKYVLQEGGIMPLAILAIIVIKKLVIDFTDSYNMKEVS